MSATLGINLMPVDPPDRFVEAAKFVDQAGFSHMFVADSSLHAHDVYPYMTLLALHTSSVRIGPLVTHPYTRHPAINLNALATINELSGGRVIANIGAGDRPVTELGYPLARTKVVREAITVMRRLLSGETVNLSGETFQLVAATLRYGLREKMPLYVTASGPRMLELGGELADGVLFLSGPDPRCVQYALDHVRAGAERSGRGLRDLVLGCNIYGALDDDAAKARRACRPIAAWFPQTSPAYASLIGITQDQIREIRRAYRGGHFDESTEAASLVTDDMIDAFSMAGDAPTWIARLREIEAMGVNLIVIFPMVDDKMAMLRRLAGEIVPQFRA